MRTTDNIKTCYRCNTTFTLPEDATDYDVTYNLPLAIKEVDKGNITFSCGDVILCQNCELGLAFFLENFDDDDDNDDDDEIYDCGYVDGRKEAQKEAEKEILSLKQRISDQNKKIAMLEIEDRKNRERVVESLFKNCELEFDRLFKDAQMVENHRKVVGRV